jgi:hypothetical protein
MELRQFSCFCEHCSKKDYTNCESRHIVRSVKHEPKTGTGEREQWEKTGWITYKMKFHADHEIRQLRCHSKQERDKFAKTFKPGKFIGVYCGGSGVADSSWFFLAELLEGEGGSVAYKWTKPACEGWAVKRGDQVLNVRWLSRVRSKVYQSAGEQTILLESVLDTDTCIDLQQKETRTSRGRTSQYKLFHLKKEDETELVRLCSVQSEVYNKKGKKRKRKKAEGE